MRRVTSAIKEWAELRKRVREEFAFHRERIAADSEMFGLGPQAARQFAKRRLGGRRLLREARQEIGADLRGLVNLLIMHGVPAQPLFRPFALALVALLVLSLSPSAKVTIESLLGTPLALADRESVFISRQAKNLSFRGVTQRDLEAIRAISYFTSVEAYQKIHLRARVRRDVDRSRIEADLGAIAGSELRLMRLFDRSPIVMSPARTMWCFVLIFGLWRVRDKLRTVRSAVHVAFTGFMHALVSLALWSVAVQLWLSVSWRTDGRAALAFVVLLVVFSGSAFLQARWWLRDVVGRCPICFERLRLAESTGHQHNTILDQATTESFCVYGHGGLREDRWSRSFRLNRSYWESLTRA